MKTHKLNFIKSNNSWFVDFKETELTPNINGVNQQHLMHLIGGWDTWLEIMSDGSDNFWMTVSDSPILNGTKLKILDKPSYKGITVENGVCYFLESHKGVTYNIEFWGCHNGFDFTWGENSNSVKSIYLLKHD
jgi:hypothetical protein